MLRLSLMALVARPRQCEAGPRGVIATWNKKGLPYGLA